MARDRSLDEFLGGEQPPENDGSEAMESGDSGEDEGDVDTGDEGDVDTGDEGDVDTGDEGDVDTGDESGVESVGPAAVEVTMAVTREGADCAACGATVERRWQGESGLVCGDCKEW